MKIRVLGSDRKYVMDCFGMKSLASAIATGTIISYAILVNHRMELLFKNKGQNMSKVSNRDLQRILSLDGFKFSQVCNHIIVDLHLFFKFTQTDSRLCRSNSFSERPIPLD